MKVKEIVLLLLLFIGIAMGAFWLLSLDRAFSFIVGMIMIPFFGPLLSLSGFFSYKQHLYGIHPNKRDWIISGYLFTAIELVILFIMLQQNIFSIGHFSTTQLLSLKIIIGVAAILLLIAQVAHLLISLVFRFSQFGFRTYFLLFFLSYISCGLSFAILYYIEPGALLINHPDGPITDAIYFSFISLATTGFGDIVPITPLSKMTVIVENLVGLIYTGYLITMIFSAAMRNKTKEPL